MVAQQMMSLPPAAIVNCEFIKALKIFRKPVYQGCPGGIYSLQFSKGGCEETVVEDGKRNSSAKDRFDKEAIESLTKGQRPLRSANEFRIVFVREISNDL